MEQNRRRFERFGTDMIFWVKSKGQMDDEFKPFTIRNISAGGISCLTAFKFHQDESVVLSFELPQHTDLIEASGKVCHVCKIESDCEEQYEIGLKFLEVKGLPTVLLLSYLEEIFK